MKTVLLPDLSVFSSGAFFLLIVVAALIWTPATARAGTELTLTITNIPTGWGTANGDTVAIIGTMNSWAVSDTAVVQDHTLTFSFSSLTLLSLDDWTDRPDGANCGFRLVSPAYPETTLIKTDFRSNDGNFRIALQEDAANTVVIHAGPIRHLVDQDSAVWVNGSRVTEFHPINRERFAFPGGRWKALVMSYDDGHVQDRTLITVFNQYGIKGTFHLNSGWLDTDTFISSEDVYTIFAPHEVSVHTVDHPDLTYVDDETVRWETGHCRWILSQLTGYDTDSMSYPMGGYDKRVMEQIAGQGITCSRTVEATASLDYMPVNTLKWHPTCHHNDATAYADDFISRTAEQMTLLFIWGHSYELDSNWDYMSNLCNKLGQRGDTWYAGMEEVRAYLDAIHQLEYPAANVIHNSSSDITIWAKPADRLIRITPGKTITWPAGSSSVSTTPLIPGDTLELTYHPGTNALRDAVQVLIHIGRNGWQDVQDLSLTRQTDGTLSVSCPIPSGTESLEWAFFNGDTIWDDNGGSDWSLHIQSTTTSVPAAVNLVEGSPVILTPESGSENAVGETPDFNTDGGTITTTAQGGFGSFGEIRINSDDQYLYLGGSGMDTGGTNNVIMLFLHVDTLSGSSENLWNFSGTPFALDFLHNVGFNPGVNVAILLGDEYGDGTFMHFNAESGYDFGQGAFYIDSSTQRFLPIPGVVLSQYDGTDASTETTDDDGNRQTDRWEVAIPWLSLHASLGARSLNSLYLFGLIGSDGVSENNRYLSANFIGASASGDLNEAGNYGFNSLTLTGLPIGLPDADSDLDGMPDVWENKYLLNAADPADGTLDSDSDGLSNQHEYLAGTNPENAASVLALASPQWSEEEITLHFEAVAGKCYALEHADTLGDCSTWSTVETLTATNSSPALHRAPSESAGFYRIRLITP